MTKTQGAEVMLQTLLDYQATELGVRCAERIVVEVTYQEKLFVAEPRGTRVLIRFGRQMFGHPSLMEYITEALRAAEALCYGLTTASAIRLDEAQRAWFEWEIGQRDQGSD